MDFKKIFTKNPCVVCGEICNFATPKSLQDIDIKYSNAKDSVVVCPECFDLFNAVKRLTSLGKGIQSREYTEFEITDTYRRIHPILARKIENMKLGWLKSELENMVIKADQIIMYNDNFTDIIHNVCDRIRAMVKDLPDKKVMYGLEIFAVNEESLFYMRYGAGAINS